MEFINLFNLPKTAKIIDIGGGDSFFIDCLIENGFRDITILDISENAINRAKTRLKEKAAYVKWIICDITEFTPVEQYDFWHDRAAFHFLNTEEQVTKYLETANKGISENGSLILGTFSESGPKKCSGLDIKQYSKESMSLIFEKYFKRIKCISENHQTPFNTFQNFLFCSFVKK
jgi:ubiquinone/menaquinone biosynthesis C-methylase UbiE